MYDIEIEEDDYEDPRIPDLNDGLAYRLDTLPWLPTDGVRSRQGLTHALRVGDGKDRVNFKWLTRSNSDHGLPNPSDRALVATLVQISAEAGFRNRSLLFTFGDVALRLGLEHEDEADTVTRIEEGLCRVSGVWVRCTVDAGRRGWSVFRFGIGHYESFQGKGLDRWAGFQWNDRVFGVLARSHGSSASSLV